MSPHNKKNLEEIIQDPIKLRLLEIMIEALRFSDSKKIDDFYNGNKFKADEMSTDMAGHEITVTPTGLGAYMTLGAGKLRKTVWDESVEL